MRNRPRRAAVPVLIALSIFALFHIRASARAETPLHPCLSNGFVRKLTDGRAACRNAGAGEARPVKQRDLSLPLDILPRERNQPSDRLRIVMRGTRQLDAFPLAKLALARAAAQWETFVETEITVVIDVDFGPLLFGEEFARDTVSVTGVQLLTGNSLYPALRASLISEASSPQEKSLLESLPPENLPADLGRVTGAAATSASLRALGLIDQAAQFGPPPAIGFNSGVDFDFDASDGIDADRLDFEATAAHEIGHVLGFVSMAGDTEIDPSFDPAVAALDLFRFRSGAPAGAFAGAERILSSGGEQHFFAGGASVPLSTARPDGAGGDERAASHWKDDRISGQYLGIMDPTLEPGERATVTDNDLSALDAIGYKTRGLFAPPNLIRLKPARSQPGAIPAPPPNLGALGRIQYMIAVPPRAEQLKIDLIGDQDIDLYVRFNQRVLIQNLRPLADHVSRTESATESITITAESTPPLREGLYLIAVGNFGTGDANFSVTATVTGGQTGRPPAIVDVDSILEGDILALEFSALDPEGDFQTAEVTLLDKEGRALAPASAFALASSASGSTQARIVIDRMSELPSAVRASIVLVDAEGGRGAASAADFTRAQAGGLTLTGVSYNGKKLTIKASGTADELELEVNGRIVAPPRKVKSNGSGSKLTIKGNAPQLNLRVGANRIRVRNSRGWSNIFMLDV
jgi:hypothetical protein